MLDEIALACALLAGIRHELAHGVQLMEAREDDLLHRLGVSVVLHANKALDDVEQAIGCQDLAVQVLGAVTVGIRRVARPVHSVAPVERHEEGSSVREPCAHLDGLGIEREVDDCAAIRFEQ